MAAYIGSPGPFDPKTHKWSSYQTQFEHFLKVNDIESDSKQTSCLIALIGTVTYEVLEGLTFPEKPADMKISALFKTLSLHFEPKRLKIAEQYRFWKHRQGPTQSLADYISEVRKLASTCQFPQEYLQDALTTAFVLGLRDETLSRKLLAEKDLTLDKAIATAQSLQVARRKAHKMVSNTSSPSEGTIDAVHQSSGRKQQSKASYRKQYSSAPPGPCPACGSREHWRANCPHKNAECNACHRTGHLARVCRDKHKGDTHSHKMPQNSYKKGQHLVEFSESLTEVTPILATNTSRDQGPMVHAKLNGYSVSLQLDTGATVTLLSETTWESIDCPTLQPTDVQLQNYSQEEIPILGKCQVKVQCQGKFANLFVVVSKGDRQNLLGRTWIDSLKLDLNKIYQIQTTTIFH